MFKAMIPLAIVSLATLGCGGGVDASDDENWGNGGGGGAGEVPGDVGGDAGTDDDGHSGWGGGGSTCDGLSESHVLKAVPPSVMLVLDKSGSMSWTWDHDDSPDTAPVTKWFSLHDVVGFIVDGYGDEMAFGAQLFPSANASGSSNACDISESSPEVPVAADNAKAIVAGIPPADADVRGGTPASRGFAAAVAHLTVQDPTSPRYVVLVTDGAANCKDGLSGSDLNNVYDDTLPARVADARTRQHILTYAIGVDIVNEIIEAPNTNPWEKLNEVAEAGGAPAPGEASFYSVSNALELAEAMTTVTGSIECTFFLSAEPDYPNLLAVDVDGTSVPRVTNCETESGWAYTSQTAPFHAVQLCGQACPTSADEVLIEVTESCPF